MRRPAVVIGLLVYLLVVLVPTALIVVSGIVACFSIDYSDQLHYKRRSEWNLPSATQTAGRILTETVLGATSCALGVAAVAALPFGLPGRRGPTVRSGTGSAAAPACDTAAATAFAFRYGQPVRSVR